MIWGCQHFCCATTVAVTLAATAVSAQQTQPNDASGSNDDAACTGAIARLMRLFATATAKQVLELGQRAWIVETTSEWGEQSANA